eukprot:CAMPEP_0175699426 /NCGR_PEP_ID=MMETSP0097-20121207/34469_1 /TAXON_ID=311494 /ORGANISM="Alexandrium monilatum, Strain CCMP3105" /LENGTH=141 /DNA_ID=CAMNT_0017006631 /DNA_START=39 /DNA_END=461 /DNA_ORIENTATION=+
MSMTSRYQRSLFKALRRVEISSWHLLGGSKHSTFLRGLANDLLADASPGLRPSPSDHRFAGDRFYWLGKPDLPGEFDAGLVTVRRTPPGARLVLAMFAPKAQEPFLLYAADRLTVDVAGRATRPSSALAAALDATAAGFTG